MADRFDVFVSCAGEDRPWVEAVLVPLFNEVHLTYVMQRAFVPGDDVFASMNRAIANARCTVLVITQAWVNSEYTQYEGRRALRRKFDEKQHRVLPLMLKLCELPEHIRDIVYLPLHESKDPDGDLRQFVSTIGPPIVPVTTPARAAARNLHLLHGVIRGEDDAAEELFKEISAQIAALSELKLFHELLHQLQSWQDILAPYLPPRNDDAIADLVVHADELRELVRELALQRKKCTISKKLLTWVDDVTLAYEILNRALDPIDPSALKQVNRITDRILGVQPPILNTQMLTLAEQLPVAELERMTEVVIERAKRNGFAADDLRRLRDALVTLKNLMQGVSELAALHNDWQNADVELRLATRSTLDELLEDWPRVRALLTSLLSSGEEWAADMTASCTQVEHAIGAGSQSRIGLELRRLRGHAVRTFHRIDIRLLQRCEELRHVRSSLQTATNE